ncbi:hypothetical protein [Paenibacillus tarimensis]|uniref:hypothetical protein n=1 Tax=Paenibacillus tarimensis TaxID=416012 RepID=UPI0039F1216C
MALYNYLEIGLVIFCDSGFWVIFTYCFTDDELQEMLDAHAETIEVMHVHVLKPIGVCMAGAVEFD